MTPSVFNLRRKSLARGNVLVLGSVLAATLLSHFPQMKPTLWIAVPAVLVLLGMADTMRNIGRRWSLYSGGVVLCLYMDLMSFFLVLFFLLFPYIPMGVRTTY